MKQKFFKYILCTALVFIGSACDERADTRFEVTKKFGNSFMVVVNEEYFTSRVQQIRASRALCDREGMTNCQVYLFAKEEHVPDSMPIRDKKNRHAFYKRDAERHERYQCFFCD
jgi:hypothetical protein